MGAVNSNIRIEKRNVPLLDLDAAIFMDESMYRGVLFPGVRLRC